MQRIAQQVLQHKTLNPNLKHQTLNSKPEPQSQTPNRNLQLHEAQAEAEATAQENKELQVGKNEEKIVFENVSLIDAIQITNPKPCYTLTQHSTCDTVAATARQFDGGV